jgi:HK97 family phage prohead protease
MPLVKPNDKETREDFMSRCMSDDKTTSEYPKATQRLAVCSTQYENDKKEKYTMDDMKTMGDAIKTLTDVISSKEKKPKDEMEKEARAQDMFSNEEDALDKAKEIGCVGTHSMDKNGKTIFMPCKTHDAYEEAISKGYGDEEEEDKYHKKPKKKSVCVCQDDGICQCDTEIKKLTFHSEVKANDDKGTFTGYGSIFGNEDQGSDIMQKGAFTKSLEQRPASKVKLLYQHKTDEPIGIFESMYEDEKGLFVKGRLAMGTQKGREAYELLKMGALDGMSIGFRADPDKQGYNENKRGTRTLKEVDLMEISLVTFPMNERALIENVKASQKSIREWEKILREVGSLSRTEAKIGAKALSESLSQRDAGDDNKQLATLINKVADILKQ